MADMNVVIMAGRLTFDPQIKYAASGTAICEFSIATTRKWKQQDQQKDETCFITVTAFGKMGENAGKYLTRGRAVLVRGYLRFQSWDDKQTGVKRTKHSLIAEDLQYLDKPTEPAPQQQNQTRATPEPTSRESFP